MPYPAGLRVGALVLAAGTGTRFGEPKQFLHLSPGVRLVDVALQTMSAVAEEVVLVLPRGAMADGSPWDGAAVSAVVSGGASRLDSVRSGLASLGPCDIVLVHDAGHPLASVSTAHAVVDAVADGADAAVPFLPVVDVLKRVRPDGSLETAGRDGLGQAQTPHGFKADALRAIHEVDAAARDHAWEDTQLVEEAGGRVVGVDGDAGNIHIVTPADLEVACALFAARRRSPTEPVHG